VDRARLRCRLHPADALRPPTSHPAQAPPQTSRLEEIPLPGRATAAGPANPSDIRVRRRQSATRPRRLQSDTAASRYEIDIHQWPNPGPEVPDIAPSISTSPSPRAFRAPSQPSTNRHEDSVPAPDHPADSSGSAGPGSDRRATVPDHTAGTVTPSRFRLVLNLIPRRPLKIRQPPASSYPPLHVATRAGHCAPSRTGRTSQLRHPINPLEESHPAPWAVTQAWSGISRSAPAACRWCRPQACPGACDWVVGPCSARPIMQKGKDQAAASLSTQDQIRHGLAGEPKSSLAETREAKQLMADQAGARRAASGPSQTGPSASEPGQGRASRP
jgi:hypothetical protein